MLQWQSCTGSSTGCFLMSAMSHSVPLSHLPSPVSHTASTALSFSLTIRGFEFRFYLQIFCIISHTLTRLFIFSTLGPLENFHWGDAHIFFKTVMQITTTKKEGSTLGTSLSSIWSFYFLFLLIMYLTVFYSNVPLSPSTWILSDWEAEV